MKLAKRVLVFVLSIAMVLPSFVVADTNVVQAAGGVTIDSTNTSGWTESAFVTWANNDTSVSSYNVYVKKASDVDGAYKKLDDQLIRCYGDYYRADAVGLAAGSYVMKVVPVTSGGEQTSSAATTSNLTVTAHDRSGFAWVDGTASGAYNEDGTLRSNAVVLYVTEETKDSIKLDVVTSTKGTTTACTGIVEILTAYKKGLDNRPLDVRFVGEVTSSGAIDADSNMGGDILVTGSGDSKRLSCGITLEGIGSDAVANGWGVRIKNASNVEVRNLGFFNCDSKELDDVGLQQSTDHIWVHNCDMFYGNAGGDSDQAKGDGALDCKKSTYITFSYNHFWDNGKCNLLGLSEGTTENLYITYHHNWYDHSDSRHPRVRYYSAHVYNNYYDGNAKYGAGATLGSSVFMEANYFRNCKYPMLVSMQGSDVYAGTTKRDPANYGTFSKEAGGSIKAYNNKMVGKYTFIAYGASKYFKNGTEVSWDLGTDSKVDFDAYVVANRNDKVPTAVKTYVGENTYNNFDTNSALMYKYTADSPDEAVVKIKKYAGRGENADFKWTFNNSVDDEAYAVNQALKNAVMNYSSKVVSIGGANPNYSGGAVTTFKATLNKSGLVGATAVLSKISGIAKNETITVTIVPDAGYEFTSAPTVTASSATVTSGPTKDGENYTANIQITGNATITVSGTAAKKSSPVTTYTATLVKTLTNATATIDKTASISSSDKVTLTVTPNSGYEFTSAPSIKVTGASLGTVSKDSTGKYTATITNATGNITVTVTGSASAVTTTKYNVTVTTDGNGTVTPTSVSLLANGQISISATPKSGYKFSAWTITAGTGATLASATSATTTLTIGSTDVTVKATFTAKTSTGDAAFVKAGGQNETIYAELSGIDASDVTAVSYAGTSSGSLNSEDIKYLVRNLNGVVRIDIPGVKAGTYTLTVVAGKSYTYSGIDVNAFDRSGYAHFNYNSGVGAYKDDGTLKANAKVIYVTNENKNTVSVTSKDGTTVTGIGNILNSAGQDSGGGKTSNGGTANSNKGIIKKLAADNTPLVIRFVGTVADSTSRDITTSDIAGLTVYNSTGNGGTVGDNGHMARIKSGKDITIEGIGYDAVIDGWGFHFMCESSATEYGKSFEVRNLKFINTAEDAIGMEGVQEGSTLTASVERCWIHNNEFYSPHLAVAAESDKHEGDGSCDFKRGQYLTVSYNYFEGCHKTNLVGSSDTSLQYNLSYHHNYWYMCKARGPLTRQANVHMYNNIFEGQTDYAMNTRANAYIFSEYNLFYMAKNPQRVDAGAIKSFNDSFASFIGSKDGTVAETKDTVVSSSNKYASFELNSSYSYIPSGNYQLQTSVTEFRKVIRAYTGVLSANPVSPEEVTMSMISKVPSGITPTTLVAPYSLPKAEKVSKTVKAFTVNTTFDIDISYSSDALTGTGVLLNEAGEVILTAGGSAHNLPAGTYIIQPMNFQAGDSLTLEPGVFKDITINTLNITPSNANYDPYELTDINLDKKAATLTVDGTLDLTVTYTPANTTSDKTVTWTSSNDTVATVVNGSVTAKSKGNAIIKATVGKFTSECIVTVSEPAILTGVTINEGNQTLTVGSSKTLTASPVPINTTDSYTVSWSSDKESVATVDAVTGKVNAVAEGSATITATVKVGDVVKGTANITVTVNPKSIPSGSSMAHNFTTSGKTSDFYSITGNLSTSKGTATYNDETLTQCLKMESSTSVTFTAPAKGNLTLVFNATTDANKLVLVDGTEYKTDENGKLEVQDMTAASHTIAKKDTINLFYMEYVPEIAAAPVTYTASLNKDSLTNATASIDKSAGLNSSDVVVLTVTPSDGYVFKSAPLVSVEGATYSIDTAVDKTVEGKKYTYNITSFTANATITVSGTAEIESAGPQKVVVKGNVAGAESDDTNVTLTFKSEDGLDTVVKTAAEYTATGAEFTKGNTYNVTAKGDKGVYRGSAIAVADNTTANVTLTRVGLEFPLNFVAKSDDYQLFMDSFGYSTNDVTDPYSNITLHMGGAKITEYVASHGAKANANDMISFVAGRTGTYNITIKVSQVDASGDQLSLVIDGIESAPVAASIGDVILTGHATEGQTIKIKTPTRKNLYYKSVSVECVPDVATIPVTGVTLNKTSATLTTGSTTVLIPTVAPADATDSSVTWSSDNESVAKVDNGVVTAVAAGNATITVTTTDRNYTATCDITVNAPAASGYKHVFATNGTTSAYYQFTSCNLQNKTNLKMESSTVVTFNAATAGTLKIVYTSESAKFAVKIDDVTKQSASEVYEISLAAGKHTIKREVKDVFIASLEFIPDGGTVDVTSVTLDKTSVTLTVGSSDIVTATVNPSGATNKSVTFASSNDVVATVDNSGNISAVGVGEATITVTTVDGGKTATCTVMVNAAIISVDSVSLDRTSMELVVGASQALGATIYPGDATNQGISWASNNTSVATVSATGVVNAVAEGSATITVTTADGDKEASCAVTVKAATVPVTGVTLNETSKTLDVNETVSLTATVAPADATNQGVIWSSTDSAVASVVDGEVVAHKTGTATIKATTIDGGFEASCAVTVSATKATLKGVVSGVEASDSNIELTFAGEDTVKVSKGNYESVGVVLPIGKTYKVTAKGDKGVYKASDITITEGMSGAITLTRIEFKFPLDFATNCEDYNLYLTTKNVNGAASTTDPYSKITLYQNGVVYSATPSQYGAKTNANDILSFVADKTGKYTVSIAVTANDTVETLALKLNDVEKTTKAATAGATTELTVNAVKNDVIKITTPTKNNLYYKTIDVGYSEPEIPKFVAEIIASDLSGATASLDKTSNILAGDTVTVTITPASGKEFKTAPTVNATGAVAGSVNAGENGTYTCEVTTFTANATITVAGSAVDKTVEVSSVSLNKTSTTLTVGNTETLTATVTPDNATNKTVTWGSDNESVATVADGVVTAVAAGNATITVTADGGKTATCTVTVNEPEPTKYTASLVKTGLTGADATLSKTSEILASDTVTVTITPVSGKEFKTAPTVSATGAVAGTVTKGSGDAYTCEVTTFTANATITVAGTATDKETKTKFALNANTEGEFSGLSGATASNSDEYFTLLNKVKGTANQYTIGDKSFTHRIQTAGKATTSQCAVKITTSKEASVKIYANQSGGSNGDVRHVVILNSTGQKVAESPALVKGTTPDSFTLYLAEAGTYYIGADVSGIDLYYIEVEEGAKEPAKYTATLVKTSLTGAEATLSKTSDILAGDTVTVTITPNSGKEFKSAPTVEATGAVAGTVTKGSGDTYTCSVTTFTANASIAVAGTAVDKTVAVSSVSLNKTSTTLTVGNTETLTATVAPSNATNKNVTWSSSNESVATVADGVVTAVAAGSATITVTTADSGKTATCTVTVNAPEPAKYTATLVKTGLTGADATINKTSDILAGDTVTVTITPASGKEFKEAPTVTVTGAVAGTVTKGSGDAYTCEVTTFTANATITVAGSAEDKTVSVTGVSLSKTEVTLTVGEKATLTATVTPSNATNKNVTWSSNKPGVATVTNDGVVTAVTAGTVVITVTTADGGKTATCTVTVNKPTPEPTPTPEPEPTPDPTPTPEPEPTPDPTPTPDPEPTPVMDGWRVENGVEYWYENGVKQGTEGRGKEIFDPATNGWYWLDAIQDGAKTINKDVYQESFAGIWGDIENPDGSRNGKWVRYDDKGLMIKGWSEKDGSKYYFDTIYGTMAKGYCTIDGNEYYFSTVDGKLEKLVTENIGTYNGWKNINGEDFWYENGVRQGVSPNASYRGKEIFDPGTNAWYWLDNVDDGKKAVSKDVYQESLAGDWGDNVNEDGEKIGKWVRYDSQGHMIKGWCAGSGENAKALNSPSDAKNADVYYFDPVYGTMAKGIVTIDGKKYEFDMATGILKK